MIRMADIGYGMSLVNDMAYIYELWKQDDIAMDTYLRLSRDYIEMWIGKLSRKEVLHQLWDFNNTLLYSERMQEVFDLLSKHPETKEYFVEDLDAILKVND